MFPIGYCLVFEHSYCTNTDDSKSSVSRGFGATAGRKEMRYRNPIAAAALAMAFCVTMSNARAFDESKYPDWKGQWLRADPGNSRYDPSKPSGRGQQAPL